MYIYMYVYIYKYIYPIDAKPPFTPSRGARGWGGYCWILLAACGCEIQTYY